MLLDITLTLNEHWRLPTEHLRTFSVDLIIDYICYFAPFFILSAFWLTNNSFHESINIAFKLLVRAPILLLIKNILSSEQTPFSFSLQHLYTSNSGYNLCIYDQYSNKCLCHASSAQSAFLRTKGHNFKLPAMTNYTQMVLALHVCTFCLHSIIEIFEMFWNM